jgi:hypothetical protein
MKNQAGKQGTVPAASSPTDTFTKEVSSDRYAHLIALQSDNVHAVLRLHTILRDGAVEWSSDLLDFAGRLFQKQLNGAGWQINSAGPFGTTASHLRFCQELTEECLDQAAKALKLTAKVSRDSRVHLENHAATILRHLER